MNNGKVPYRLPAGALILVLVVSILVAAILLSLVMLTTNRQLLVQRDMQHQELRRNLSSGMAYAQAATAMPYFRRLTLNLFDTGSDSVRIDKKPWGVFDVAVTSATKGLLADTLAALLGSQFAPVSNAALYLADERVPLSVNEDAQVRGDAYLCRAEPARTANLPLIGPRRTGEAITGSVQSSHSLATVASPAALARLHDYAGLQLAAWLPPLSVTSAAFRSQRVSFAGPATVLYQSEPLTLRGLSLSGQVVVVSARRLVVEASNTLDNVLLLAPVVVIKPGFRGRVQIIARDTVDIQQDSELLYPSAVCGYSHSQATHVLLGPNSRVNGVVIAAQGAGNSLPCVVHMASGAAVQGQVFSAGSVENCGAVRGTVMCQRLVYRTATTFFDNYLVNALIDRSALPSAFLTTALLNPGASTGTIAWVR